jgi:hypothetical protein
MRQLALPLVMLLLFVASFGAIYISFRTSAPHIKALVGGDFSCSPPHCYYGRILSRSPQETFSEACISFTLGLARSSGRK